MTIRVRSIAAIVGVAWLGACGGSSGGAGSESGGGSVTGTGGAAAHTSGGSGTGATPNGGAGAAAASGGANGGSAGSISSGGDSPGGSEAGGSGAGGSGGATAGSGGADTSGSSAGGATGGTEQGGEPGSAGLAGAPPASGGSTTGGSTTGGSTTGGSTTGGSTTGGSTTGGSTTGGSTTGGSTTGGSTTGGSNTGGAPGVPCSADSGCSGGRCELDLGSCVECLFDTDCGASERCRDHRCEPALSCASGTECSGASGDSVCMSQLGYCVECDPASYYYPICPQGEACVNYACVPYETCTNSLDCTGGKVCNRDRGACVECVLDADCTAGNVCQYSECVPACASDTSCVPLGLLCNGTGCVECVFDADCPTTHHCRDGACALDRCDQGTSWCNASKRSVIGCNARGDAFATRDTCDVYTESCRESGRTAQCTPRICPPGSSACSEDRSAVLTCTADGLDVVAETPCGPDQLCQDGYCYDLRCDAGPTGERTYCTDDHLTMVWCSEYGLYREDWACGSGAYCDDAAGCVPAQCAAGAPACNGNSLVTCTSWGALPDAATGTNCLDSRLLCDQGACVASVTTAVGGTATYSSSSGALMIGDIFSVTSPRRLTQYGLAVTFTDTRDITFAVYEGTGSGATFTRIYEATRSVAGSSAEFLVSDSIDVPLQVGRWYVLAVFWTDTAYNVTYRSSSLSDGPVPFGRVEGGLSAADHPATLVVSNTATYGTQYRSSVTVVAP